MTQVCHRMDTLGTTQTTWGGMESNRSSIIEGKGGTLGAVRIVLVSVCRLLLHRVLILKAHRQVDKSEDVVFDHDREAEEDCVQDQNIYAQLQIQTPLVQMNAQYLFAVQNK